MDKVAVLMSTYNGEKYLSIQIDSILAQEGVEVELYIRDDGSSDSTVEIINKYAEKDKRVKFVPGPPLGVGRSFMTLLGMNNDADYFSFADQDDYWYPNKLQSGIRKIKECKSKTALYCCNQNCVDSDGAFLYKRFPDSYNIPSVISIVLRNEIAGCTMIMNSNMRSEIIENLPPFDYFKLMLHDAWIMCVASITGVVLFDKKPYMDFRRHQSAFSEESIIGYRKKSVIKYYYGKINRLKKRKLKKRNTTSKMAIYIITLFGSKLSDEDIRILEIIGYYLSGIRNKIKLLKNKKIFELVKNDRLSFYSKVMLNML